MYAIRVMETTAATLYRSRVIRGFCHLYSGQEAIAVGFCKASRPQDSFISSYRVHAWALLISKNVTGVLSELTGRHTGLNRGKGGSMHMYINNLYGGNGIVADQFKIPVGTGIALAHWYAKDGGVCVTAYGDGAANQGQAFEAYNMAKLWGLPCIYICENNQFAMGTSIKRGSSNQEYYKRLSIPGLWIDAMDVLTVLEAARFAFDYCSSGNGPLIIEASTYRFTGHSMTDSDTTYRTRDELTQAKKTNDPINNFKDKIINAQVTTKEEIKEIENQVNEEIKAATKIASEAPTVDLEELGYDIYKNNIDPLVRGVVPESTWSGKSTRTPEELLKTVIMAK